MKLHILTSILVAASLATGSLSAQTNLGPLNLPSSFQTLPLSENFEAAAGVVPSYMAVTELNSTTLLPDPQAWANIGQHAPCINPFSGSFALEMGLIPDGTTNYHNVRNALVIGLDGTGYTGSQNLSFYGYDAGEETNAVDGVWLSNDGVNWYRIYGPWTNLPSISSWDFLSLIDLTSTPISTAGQFYLAFVQEDNFPYNDLDGVGIDEISIPSGLPVPELSISPTAPQSGAYATLNCDSGLVGANCAFLASLTGAGPSTVQGVDLNLSLPVITVATLLTDVNGNAVLSSIVPAVLAGQNLWLQCVVYNTTTVQASTSLALTVL